MFQIINHLIDVIQHIVVDEEYGFPQSAYEACLILKERAVFAEEDLLVLRKMIGFRNVIGHDYIDLDKSVVYSILCDGLKDIRWILEILTDRFL